MTPARKSTRVAGNPDRNPAMPLPCNDDGLIDRLLAASFATMAALFGFLYDAMYWRWRDCYNELGRCFNPDDSYAVYTTAGAIWSLPCIACAAAAFWFALRCRRARREIAADRTRNAKPMEPRF
jgi:hypothetical protein